ncbi:hypothetical protein ACP0HM_13675 [Escherichia coli]
MDPVVHLPNVRALNRALRDAPGLRFVIYASHGMEMLVKNYGIMLRIQYKQKLSHWLSPLLEPGEDVYQLSGNDLALRLNTESHRGSALPHWIAISSNFVSFGMACRCNRRLASVTAMCARQ